MTYREKLQKEHPEYVNDKYTGGCRYCPRDYNYGPETSCNCSDWNETKCTDCWNKVIPGTEDELTFKIPTNLDEMIQYFKAHGFEARRTYDVKSDTYSFHIVKDNRGMIDVNFKYPKGKTELEKGLIMLDYCECLIVEFNNDVLETKQRCIDDLYKAVDRRDKEIAALKDESERKFQAKDAIIDAQERRNEKLEGACSAKNAEIVRLRKECDGCHMTIGQLEKELNEEKTRKYFYCEDNCCAMVKDKEINELKEKNENQSAIIKGLHEKISKKDVTIDYYETRCDCLEYNNRMLRETLAARDSTIYRLEKDLEAERKEHAKHHGFFARFN